MSEILEIILNQPDVVDTALQAKLSSQQMIDRAEINRFSEWFIDDYLVTELTYQNTLAKAIELEIHGLKSQGLGLGRLINAADLTVLSGELNTARERIGAIDKVRWDQSARAEFCAGEAAMAAELRIDFRRFAIQAGINGQSAQKEEYTEIADQLNLASEAWGRSSLLFI